MNTPVGTSVINVEGTSAVSIEGTSAVNVKGAAKSKSTMITPPSETVNVKSINVEGTAKSKSTTITPASETIDVEAVNVEGTSAGNDEGTSANMKQKNRATTEEIQVIEELDSLHLDTPPETLNSLRAYEKKTGEAQRFLGTSKIFFIYFIISPECNEGLYNSMPGVRLSARSIIESMLIVTYCVNSLFS